MRATLLWLHPTIRISLAVFFLWAAIAKLMAPDQFAEKLGEFGLIQETWLPVAAWGLILAESAAGVGLLFGQRLAVLAALALLIFFSVILAYGLSIGLDIDCGCLGSMSDYFTLNLEQALLRNLALMPFVAYLWLRPRKSTISEKP